jgi:hypothetical protein
MSQNLISIQQLQRESWLELVEEWGHGKAQPRYVYSRDCTLDRFPNHLVLQGPHPSGSGFTDSGFLVDSSRNVVGGVDAINRTD